METGADVLVTTRALYERKIAALRPRLPHLRHVLIVADGAGVPEHTLDFRALMNNAS